MTDQEETVIVFAMRYALGRNTAAPWTVAQYIRNVWNELSAFTQEQIQREIMTEMALRSEIRTCVEWEGVLDLKIKNEEIGKDES